MTYYKVKKFVTAAVSAFAVLACIGNTAPTQVLAAEFEASDDFKVSDLTAEVLQAAESESYRIRQEKAQVARTEAKKRAEEEAEKREKAAKRQAEEEAARKAAEAEKARLEKRQEIVDFAMQFEGNPYVYGGTSLTNGADCSGFIMSVFKEFGYTLPRVAADQAVESKERTLEELEPGDLIFYGGWGIGHVALYIGDQKIIHASTEQTGILVSDYDYDVPVKYGTYLD